MSGANPPLYCTPSGFLPDILLFTQAPILVWFDGTIIVHSYYRLDYVLQCLMFCYAWWLCCMVINISGQYNGGFFPDIILLTQCYYHYWGTRLNTMKWLCIYSLCNSILLLPCLVVHCTTMFLFCFYCFSGVLAWRLM